MNRNHLNLGLLVAVAGLGTAAWLGQKPDEEKKPPLTALTPSMVQTIALEHPGSPTIRLAKQDGQWAITEPVKAAADPFEVNALVGLSDTSVQMKLDSGDLKELGLVPARYRITINDQTIDFGGEEPLKYRRYVRVNEKELALIADRSDVTEERRRDSMLQQSERLEMLGQAVRTVGTLLEQLRGWRERCRTAVCFVVELWTSYIHQYERYLPLLDQFDHVFILNRGSIEVLSRHTSAPVSFLATGVERIVPHGEHVCVSLGKGSWLLLRGRWYRFEGEGAPSNDTLELQRPHAVSHELAFRLGRARHLDEVADLLRTVKEGWDAIATPGQQF